MPPPDAPTAERRIGRYLLQEELGRGGMGIVHAAWDETLDRRVALKLLRFGDPTPPAPDLTVAERFAQEMRIAVTLEHPNIVPVYETGDEDGVHYIAMRLVEGQDLGAVIRREAAAGHGLFPGRVARIGRQLAAALDAAHARGLVHRDVKPGNVLLTGTGDEEHVYLTDFGLTREADGGVTQTGQWVGTVDYAAPEQIEAGAVGPRTDVYALACVLYHALTGALPFTGTFAAKATAHVTAPLPSVGTGVVPDPARIDAVLAMATAKDPERRHASAGALARAFARAVADTAEDAGQRTMAMQPITPEAAVAPAPPPRPRPRARPVPAAAPGPDPAPTAVRPVRPRGAAAGPPPEREEPAPASVRRAPLPWVLAGVLALLVVGVVALAATRGGGDPAGQAADTTASPPTTSSAASAAPPTSTTATTPAPTPKLPTTDYTAQRGGYTAKVPGDAAGWSVQGEQDLGGVLRSTFTGPDGQQLWIDATPTMAPAFGREGRTVTQVRKLDGPLGTIAGYRFTGTPAEFCGGGCVDYQLDLGGHGYAVIAGPTPAARLAARTTIMSLRPVPDNPVTPPAGTPPATTPPAGAAPPASTPRALTLPPGVRKQLQRFKHLKPFRGRGHRDRDD